MLRTNIFGTSSKNFSFIQYNQELFIEKTLWKWVFTKWDTLEKSNQFRFLMSEFDLERFGSGRWPG